jgi:STAS domain
MEQDEGTAPVIVRADLLGVPPLALVDALCRAALRARRRGARLEIRDASPELRELLELCGVAELVPCRERSAREPGREAEQREQPSVEEERDPGDPVA